MTRTLLASLLTTLPILVGAQSPLTVGELKISEPATLTELNMDRLRGVPSRLAWSPDGAQLYVQTLEGSFGQGDAKLRHYLFSSSNGAQKEAQAEPEWAAAYWAAKSHQAAPDVPGYKIGLESEVRAERTTSTPMGGDLARGGVSGGTGGTSATEAISAANTTQGSTVHVMKLKGETIGEFINSVIVPGLTFGWGPKGTKVIAFAAPKTGRLVVMNDAGLKQEVNGSKEAVLPAWSPDGARLAWLQKQGRKAYLLRIAQVSGT